MYLLVSALSLQIYKQHSDLSLKKKKKIKEKSDFKLTGTNKCFISINNLDCTRKPFVSEYLIVGTFRNTVVSNKAKKEF